MKMVCVSGMRSSTVIQYCYLVYLYHQELKPENDEKN